MRVLVVSPVVPWPCDTGGRIRTAKLVRELCAHAEVHLWAVRQPWLAPGVPPALERDGVRVRVFERSRLPAPLRPLRTHQERWFHSDALAAALRAPELAREFDLVHVDEPCALRHVPRTLALPLVVHHHKLDSLLHARLFPRPSPRRRLEALQLARLEREAAARTRHHVLTSPDDAAVLAARFPALELALVPSGFDADYFVPRADAPERSSHRLLFLGTLDYAPNVDGLEWFLREVWPGLRARRPGLALDVVGRDPPERLQREAPEGVRVWGRVDDVRPHLERAACLVAALRVGGGTRLKVVDALAMLCPVAGTSAAVEGLELEDGEHLVVADDAQGYARAVEGLLDDPARAQRLARAGRARVLERYPWERLAADLARAWRAALSADGRTVAPGAPDARAPAAAALPASAPRSQGSGAPAAAGARSR